MPHDDHLHDHSIEHRGHSHGGHSHAPTNFGMAFAIGVILNAGFVVLEVTFGILGHSVALLADAGHNLSDLLSLVVAWGASRLATRAPTARFTYGLRGTSVLAALFNAVLLLVVTGGLSWEAIQRFFAPEPVAGKTIMVVAAAGIVLNGVCAAMFASGRKGDLNIRGAFTHMLADAAVSAGVMTAGFLIFITGWQWLDPLTSLLVNAIIIWGTWSLLRDGLAMALNAVPAGIEPQAVEHFLTGKPGVTRLHDLHIWPMSTTETALTAHLVMPAGHPGDDFLMQAASELRQHFSIGHVTLQVETDETTECALAPTDHV
ncbi:MAG: cation transporter [Methylobacteriaceae bacterium]|nr:cation transporter [Methylobacteriaceae bacterium]